ncbi:hypothetical protein PUNSTDRAFT_130920 [Punctularia strigosozonata HHB-11173 SS5]|uniref:uncharacterized protein n=1 Tax=Punctularia strigosozonata (strain HHB-11173) TaxID=741275 RepID=UPI00044175DA|nr:uncharacterized protein PUNSTDRAFT_130920 [Punctularia strigosozonata HHB-11173 SS5]EIN12666.1 hypothetical protein PUNSTDRAFT_130920 [Punctularia strigosozonata HHB-11173 SS5]
MRSYNQRIAPYPAPTISLPNIARDVSRLQQRVEQLERALGIGAQADDRSATYSGSATSYQWVPDADGVPTPLPLPMGTSPGRGEGYGVNPYAAKPYAPVGDPQAHLSKAEIAAIKKTVVIPSLEGLGQAALSRP